MKPTKNHHLSGDCSECQKVIEEAEKRGAKEERKKMLEGTWASELREKLWKGKSPKEVLESDPIKEAEQRGFQEGIGAVEAQFAKVKQNREIHTKAAGGICGCPACDPTMDSVIEAARKEGRK